MLKMQCWGEAVECLIQAYELMPDYKKQAFWESLCADVLAALTGMLESARTSGAVGEMWQLESVTADHRERLAQVFTGHAIALFSEGRFEEALTAFSQNEGLRAGELQSL